MLIVTDFRQAGDADDSDAFKRALDAVEALDTAPNSFRGTILLIPFGQYKLSKSIEIRRQIILQGEGGAGDFAGTVLLFTEGIDGLVVHTALSDREPGFGLRHSGAGDWTVIRDLALGIQAIPPIVPISAPLACPLRPSVFPSEEEFEFDPLTVMRGQGLEERRLAGNGIVLYGRARIENCKIEGFRFDGIHIESHDPSPGAASSNANIWQIQNCRLINNGRHGLYVMGGQNSNGGCCISLDSMANCHWGIYDRSFLGNSYVACHVADNGHTTTLTDGSTQRLGGGYKTDGTLSADEPRIGRNTLVGCYSEQDQNPSGLNEQTVVVGGLHGAGFSVSTVGGALILNDSGVSGQKVMSPVIHASRKIDSNANINVPSPDEVIFVDASQRDVQLVLPPLNILPALGREYTVKRLDGTKNNVVIRVSVPGFESVDETGVDSYLLHGPHSCVTLLAASSTEWRVVARMEPLKFQNPASI